jgi:hypothetical protein
MTTKRVKRKTAVSLLDPAVGKSDLDHLTDFMRYMNVGMYQGSRLKEVLKIYRDNHPRTFHKIMASPTFSKIWLALEDMAINNTE